MMNKLLVVFSLFCTIINAQSTDDSSVLLEFGKSEENSLGLVLPSISEDEALKIDGNLFYDLDNKDIKAFVNGSWLNLTDNNQNENFKSDLVETDNKNNYGGVLFFASRKKAISLPKIFEPHINVYNPYPGLICYDTKSNMLAVFDGELWHYWK